MPANSPKRGNLRPSDAIVQRLENCGRFKPRCKSNRGLPVRRRRFAFRRAISLKGEACLSILGGRFEDAIIEGSLAFDQTSAANFNERHYKLRNRQDAGTTDQPRSPFFVVVLRSKGVAVALVRIEGESNRNWEPNRTALSTPFLKFGHACIACRNTPSSFRRRPDSRISGPRPSPG